MKRIIRKKNALRYVAGTFFEQDGYADLYILAQTEAKVYRLISLTSGNRYVDEKVTDYFLEKAGFKKVEVTIEQ